MTEYVAYYRVSSQSQGRSGLGLQAQKAAVTLFIGGQKPIGEFEEVESGRRRTRPELTKALALAVSKNATLITAKLDRLSRNARFLLEILESGVEIVFCDFPDMPKGPMNKFFLTMMAAVAELESGMISDRTRAALRAAKSNGVQLGTAGKALAAKNHQQALERALVIKPKIISLQRKGIRSAKGISAIFNANGVKTLNGGPWHPTTVQRILNRLET